MEDGDGSRPDLAYRFPLPEVGDADIPDRGIRRPRVFRRPPARPDASTPRTASQPMQPCGPPQRAQPAGLRRSIRMVRVRSGTDRTSRERLAREAAMVRGSETLHGMFDGSGRALARNGAMRDALGAASGHFLDMFEEEDERRRAAAALRGGSAYRGLGRLRVRAGGPWYRIVGNWRTDPVSGEPALFVEAVPVNELREEAAHYRHLAETDALTGLLSRRAVLERLQELCGDRRARPLSVILADLDHFKRVNDRFGHAAGDRVLTAFARILREALRGDDLCGRLGGEEFLLVLPRTGPEAAAGVARRICGWLRTHLAAAADIPGDPLTASFGVSAFAAGDGDPRAALERADRALYRAKAAGRGRVEVEAAGPTRR
ncbi:putative diguanylate cyclase YedQ [bacterium HR39]|nr:putative diguanylate cyclase YedQ [bacterium HR39]